MKKEDIDFVKSVLPDHYEIETNLNPLMIGCRSSIGFRIGVDGEDDKGWQLFFAQIKSRFGSHFSEVYHTVCSCHTRFQIWLNPTYIGS